MTTNHHPTLSDMAKDVDVHECVIETSGGKGVLMSSKFVHHGKT
jgi:hypothetical protein